MTQGTARALRTAHFALQKKKKKKNVPRKLTSAMGDAPASANEHCVGPSSTEAGKAKVNVWRILH